MSIFFNRVMQLSSPLFAASVTYLIPIVALLWGVLDGETVYPVQFAGMGVCLIGIWLVKGCFRLIAPFVDTRSQKHKTMYQTILNQQPATIDFTANGPILNGEPFTWDMVRISDRTFHILYQHQSYTAEVLEMNAAEKTVSLKINGHLHQVKVKIGLTCCWRKWA